MDYDRLRELQEKFEENPRRYFAPLANEYRKGGQPKRAIEICRTQLAQMPSHMSGLIVFGQALYEASEFNEAREVFERALGLDPENLIALRSLGDMSLQSGDTVAARSWYNRLLDADPKDTSVIALVSEIDASAEAAPIAPPEALPIDSDAGDQAIPFITDATGAPLESESQPAASAAPAEMPEETAPATTPAIAEDASPPPLGLERHYPVEPETSDTTPKAEAPKVEAPEAAAEPEEPRRVSEAQTPAASDAAPPSPAARSSFEDEIPLGAEGLHSAVVSEPRGADSLRSLLKPTPPMGTEGLQGRAKAAAPEGAEGLKGKPVPSPLQGASGSRSDDDTPLDTWSPPPGADVHERVESPKEERMFSGSTPEPFVNETMAQLYLQQGYRQLALKVYYQLAEARPNDQGLKDRIAEIEPADPAEHPETVDKAAGAAPAAPVAEARRNDLPAPPVAESRRETAAVERPSVPPPTPRSPSIETPTPGPAPDSEESPSFDRTPVDSPPSAPSRQRESIESPAREEPRAEPEGIAAPQPSIKEFFATLGRRRPPRAAASAGPSSTRNAPSVPAEQPPAATAAAGPPASLDAVFAGATVNPADSRAASRLAGAFSGVSGGTAPRTPPTPPTPTPRVNPRLPQAQESEEDVAKFRAWLDGLTGE